MRNIWLENCRPWKFYGHFSVMIKTGHRTSSLSSFTVASNILKNNVTKLQTLEVLRSLFSDLIIRRRKIVCCYINTYLTMAFDTNILVCFGLINVYCCHFYNTAAGKLSKIKSPRVGTLSQQGGGGSDQKGRMYQPAYLVVGRVCPNHLIWSVEHIRCPKFGRGQGSPVLHFENVPGHEASETKMCLALKWGETSLFLYSYNMCIKTSYYMVVYPRQLEVLKSVLDEYTIWKRKY